MFFKYKATYFDEDYNEQEDRGLVCGKNYSEAAEHVYEDYGDLVSMYLMEWNVGNTVTLNEIKEGFGL